MEQLLNNSFGPKGAFIAGNNQAPPDRAERLSDVVPAAADTSEVRQRVLVIPAEHLGIIEHVVENLLDKFWEKLSNG
jgi:hypothetical protein